MNNNNNDNNDKNNNNNNTQEIELPCTSFITCQENLSDLQQL